MKAKDLIELLESLREDEEVYFLAENSHYPEDFSKSFRRGVEIRAFWGKDKNGTILVSGGQVGGI